MFGKKMIKLDLFSILNKKVCEKCFNNNDA